MLSRRRRRRVGIGKADCALVGCEPGCDGTFGEGSEKSASKEMVHFARESAEQRYH